MREMINYRIKHFEELEIAIEIFLIFHISHLFSQVIPGGSSVPVLKRDEIENCKMDFDALR